ncbi:MAG: 5'/3'-nucleotidase SurE [Candidatus Kariarchaeaceae archaeon]|jgi:5'/3'-nucleotidase SurE
MKILLTNDDGYDSCALLPTIEILETISMVDVVVPEQQQSWTSKANIRRQDKIPLRTREVGGRTIQTLDALPADCANYGLYQYDELPDLLVSGANLGMNIGLGMYLSSGTIGAALEGLLAGVPSIAISCPYKKGEEMVSSAFVKSLKHLPTLIKAFYDKEETKLAMLSLNLTLGKENPYFYAVDMEKYHFGGLFKKGEEGFVEPKHYYELPSPTGENEGTDSWAKVNELNSVVGLDAMAQLIEKSYVNGWLQKNNLTK